MMGGLKDQLLKARLITEKQARQVNRQQRQERKELGIEGLEKKQGEKQAQFEAEKQAKSERDKLIEAQKKAELLETERLARLKDIVVNGEIRIGRPGNIRFHFVTRESRIAYLEVSSKLADDLSSGKAAIVEMPGLQFENFKVISRDAALKIRAESSQSIRFFQSSGNSLVKEDKHPGNM